MWPLNGDSTVVYPTYHSIQLKVGFHQRKSRSCNQKRRNLRSGENSVLVPPLRIYHLRSSQNQVVGVGSRSEKTKTITKHGNVHCDWFILPFLLLTPTIWFSLDCKQRSHKRSPKKMETFRFFRPRFCKVYDSACNSEFFIFTDSIISALTTLLPTLTLLLVKPSRKRPTLLGRNNSLF